MDTERTESSDRPFETLHIKEIVQPEADQFRELAVLLDDGTKFFIGCEDRRPLYLGYVSATEGPPTGVLLPGEFAGNGLPSWDHSAILEPRLLLAARRQWDIDNGREGGSVAEVPSLPMDEVLTELCNDDGWKRPYWLQDIPVEKAGRPRTRKVILNEGQEPPDPQSPDRFVHVIRPSA